MFRYRNKYRPYGVLNRQQGGTSSPLLTDLVACWKLDEVSGTRFDSHGSNNLTDNNTVGSATGKLGNAASFDAANAEYLSRASTADLQSSAAFTIAFWIKPDFTAPLDRRGLIFKGGNTAASALEYLIRQPGNDIDFFVNSGSLFANVSGITSAEWSLVVAWYDGQANLWVKSESGTTLTGTAPATGFSATTEPFEIGRYWGGNYYTGLIDQIIFAQRAWGSSDRDSYWNGGSGLVCPF